MSSDSVPTQATDLNTPELQAFYANRPLMWRNVLFTQLGWWGHNICFTVIGPLMLLRMKETGITESAIGLVTAINSWAVSFLVMYFSWKSDHLVSRWGRRVPFLLISMPFIVVSVYLFPFFHKKEILIALWMLQMFFMDMKLSTYPLLSIDLIPRAELGRINAVSAIIGGLSGFLVMRYGMRLSEYSYTLTYILCGSILLIFTLGAAFGIREPPIKNPTTKRFKPWSTFKVGWQDKRIIPLMMGVSAIHSFLMMFGGWLWLFAAHDLKLSRSDCGDALSWASLLAVVVAYPFGWLIDHVKGIKLVTAFLVFQWVLFFMVLKINSVTGLLAASLVQTLFAPLYSAADLMVYRNCPGKDVGSVTSSLAFLRNMYAGFLSFFSGWLITHGGTNYHYAFILGIGMSTLALPLFFVNYWLMRRSPVSGTTSAAN